MPQIILHVFQFRYISQAYEVFDKKAPPLSKLICKLQILSSAYIEIR